ncbi:MAG: HAD hydrolase-like protein [Chthoniobacteraceae bacterium]
MHLLFDLDGTLTDPFQGITRSIQYALEALGQPPPPAEALRWCIGPPLKKSFLTLLGPGSEADAEMALAKYRERFSSVGLYENAVFPGIAEMLEELCQSAHTLHVATSKPTVFAREIIDHFGLAKYFHSVHGSELDGTRSDKTCLIAHLLAHEGIPPQAALMIGDREHDMIGARQNQVAGLGVLWGYGTRDELEAAGAFACAASPGELPSHCRDFSGS